MIATLSADIVRSTSLATRDLIALRASIRRLFEDFEKDNKGFWGRIVRGDTLECFVPDYWSVLRIAILIKLYVKMRTSEYSCSEMLQRHGIRFSIGMGDLHYIDKEEDIIEGPAIYLSGRNLDEMSRNSNLLSCIEIDNAPDSFNVFLNSYVTMASSIVDSYSLKQSEVIFYKLLGFKEVEISRRLGIYQSSVNTRSTSAQWGVLHSAIVGFENLNYETICGKN